jgi:hypothetical protein
MTVSSIGTAVVIERSQQDAGRSGPPPESSRPNQTRNPGAVKRIAQMSLPVLLMVAKMYSPG